MTGQLREMAGPLIQSTAGESFNALRVELEDLMTDMAGRLREESDGQQHLHRLSTLSDQLSLRLYIHAETKD